MAIAGAAINLPSKMVMTLIVVVEMVMNVKHGESILMGHALMVILSMGK